MYDVAAFASEKQDFRARDRSAEPTMFPDGSTRTPRTMRRNVRMITAMYDHECLCRVHRQLRSILGDHQYQRLHDWVEATVGREPSESQVGLYTALGLHVAAQRLGNGHTIESLFGLMQQKRSAIGILFLK